MKRRAEEEYAYYQAPLVTGSAASGVQAERDDDAPAAVLWVPDIDCRHKWREYYVDRERDKPGERAYGFKPGKKG